MSTSRDGLGGQTKAFRQREAETSICYPGLHAPKWQSLGCMGGAPTAFPTTKKGIWTISSKHWAVIKHS